MYKSTSQICAVLGAAMLIPAVAFAGQPDDELRERATAYWQARIDGEKTVLDYYPPESRESVLDSGNISFSEFAIEGVEVEEGDSALVRIRVRANFALPPSFPKLAEEHYRPLLSERWDRIDGVWYKRPVENGLHRLMPQQAAKPTGLGSDVKDVTQDVTQDSMDPHSESSKPNG